jgi:hypothetical protein
MIAALAWSPNAGRKRKYVDAEKVHAAEVAQQTVDVG